MPIGAIIEKALEGGVGGIFDGASKIIQDVVTNPTEKLQASTALATLKAQHEEAMGKIANDAETAILSDVQSARAREVAIDTSDKAPLLDKIILPVLAIFVTFGFFGILTFMLLHTVPITNSAVLNIMLGSLGTAWIGIIGYFFGSSLGSSKKDDTIKTLSNS